jgi:hypothetical protein
MKDTEQCKICHADLGDCECGEQIVSLQKLVTRLKQANHAHANILEAFGSIVETRCYLLKMRRLSEECPMPDWTAVVENLQGALRESETVMIHLQRMHNEQRDLAIVEGGK